MKGRLSGRNQAALRAILTAGCIGAFLFSLLLSVEPQLHERLHASDNPTHQCAVTLLSAGNCEHSPCNTIAIAPSPLKASTLVCRHSHFVSARLDFSLLEHAPPTFA